MATLWQPASLPIPPLTFRNQQAQAKASQQTKKVERDFTQYALDPVGFIERELKTILTVEQKAIAQSVLENPVTLAQSAHSVGKTRVAAALALWFVLCKEGLAVTTAPTNRQVKELLWSEIRKAIAAHSLPLRSGTLFCEKSETARAYGFSARDNNSNAAQGIHAEKLLFVFDEACGISAEIWDAAESCTTGTQNRLLAIGNPIVAGCPFEQACSVERPIIIPVWGHPNVAYAYEKHPDGIHRLKPEYSDPESWKSDLIPGAISIDWIERIRKKKKETSLFWQSRIEAKFPGQSGASIIPKSEFEKARARYDENPELWDAIALEWMEAVGADVGDGGDDHGVALWRGPVLYSVESISTLGDRRDTYRLAEHLKDNYPNAVYGVDATGVGSGTTANLLTWGLPCEGILWGEAAEDSEQYENLKAEQYATLWESWDEIAIAPLGEYEDMAKEDLSKTYYEEGRKGRFKMEEKMKTRKRLGRSPNIGDAIVFGYSVRRRLPRNTTRKPVPKRASYGLKY